MFLEHSCWLYLWAHRTIQTWGSVHTSRRSL